MKKQRHPLSLISRLPTSVDKGSSHFPVALFVYVAEGAVPVVIWTVVG